MKNPSVTIKELKENKSYKFKVRAYYKTSFGVFYGEFSDVITVKTKTDNLTDNLNKNSTATLISASKAVSIALNNAGLKKSQVRDLSYELDKENGIKVYDVEFEYGKYEYSYEINAINGKILHKEKERK